MSETNIEYKHAITVISYLQQMIGSSGDVQVSLQDSGLESSDPGTRD